MASSKYSIVCTACGAVVEDFGAWFSQGQKCQCGCARAEVQYHEDYSKLLDLCGEKGDNEKRNVKSLFHYFDFLPLHNEKDIVSFGEGATPIEKWNFLSEYAKQKYGIDCTVYVSRSDMSGGTGTFKDPAAALGASLFKEYGVKEYCVASTGNTASAFSLYLSEAGVKCNVFVPCDVCEDTSSLIKNMGQNLIVSPGNYAQAKTDAASYSKENNVLITMGNIDPIRVESKRTLVFEYLRQLGRMPDVYLQAVAGGTAPIAMDKGVRELNVNLPSLDCRLPRMILAQQDKCDPMVQAWESATKAGFPELWEKDYPSIAEPNTKISILSTGTPGMYPIVAPIVRKSVGAFVRVKEESLVELAKWVYENKKIVFGPASMVCIAGFLKSLEEGLIRDGDVVALNPGEGSGRAQWFKNQVLK